MSSDSLALLRRNASSELTSLAEQHIKHDLTSSDRDALKFAASTFSTYTSIGSILGLGLGAVVALRVRRFRMDFFRQVAKREKPVSVVFKDGRTEPFPDPTPLLAPSPSTFGTVATYFLFSLSGLFIGGETGLLLGSYSARKTIMDDPERKRRVESAFRRFKADVLRRELGELERVEEVKGTGNGEGSVLEKWF